MEIDNQTSVSRVHQGGIKTETKNHLETYERGNILFWRVWGLQTLDLGKMYEQKYLQYERGKARNKGTTYTL